MIIYTPWTWGSASLFAPRVITDTTEWAGFAEDRLKLLDNLSVVGAVRYDVTQLRYTNPTLGTPLSDNSPNFNKNFYAPSGRVGLVYNPLPHTSLYVQDATAVASVGTLITTTLAQSQFKLASGNQIEGGIKQTFWNQKGQWTFSAYRIVETNLLTPNAINPTVSDQVGQQSSQGLEGSAMLQFARDWRL